MIYGKLYLHRTSGNKCFGFVKRFSNSTGIDNENIFVKNKGILPFEKMPTARRLPFIGTKLEFLLCGSGKKLHEYIDKRHRQLGPIFREPLGPVEGVFISSPDLMRDVFLYEGKYPKHPLPEAWTLYNETHNCKRGLFFMEGEEWLHNRKIMNLLLLRDDFGWTQEVTQKYSMKLVSDWKELLINQNDYVEVPNVITSLYCWSINVIIAIMLGNTPKSVNTDLATIINEFCKNVHKIFECSAPLMTIPPAFAKKYKLNIWTQFENSVTNTLQLANSIIDIALRNNQTCPNSIIFKMKSQGMSTDAIKRIFIDLIIAAGDTTAFSTQWALYLLAHDLDMQNQVRDDVLLNPGTYESILIRGTVKEALRMFPVAAFVGRFLAADCVIGKFEIKKHTLVLISLYTSGRDEQSFPEANKFLPCRWKRDIDGSFKYVNRSNAIYPYSLGVRACVGQKIANLQMHFLLTEVLKHFHLKLLNKNDIKMILKMIAVPHENIKLGIKMCKR